MNKTEIKEKIAKLEKAIASPATPDAMKTSMKGTVEKLQAQLEQAEKESEKEAGKEKEKKLAKEKKKEAKKAVRKKARNEKLKQQAKERNSKKIIFEGKEISKNDADYCDKLLAAWNKRREKAKASAKKSKTKPVFEKVAGSVESGVFHAIKSIPAKKISENPDKYIKLFKDIEDHTEKFLMGFKQLLGEEYDKKEIDDSLKPINDFISKLKDKFKK